MRMRVGNMSACSAAVIVAFSLSGCSAWSDGDETVFKPSACASGADLIRLDGCRPGEQPALTERADGAIVASCSVLTAADLERIAAHNAGELKRCQAD